MARRKRSKVFPACFRYAKRHAGKGHAAFDRALHACLTKRARFGAPSEEHASRARGGVRAIRELAKIARENIARGDCVRAAGAMISLAQEEGAYQMNREDSGGRKSPAGFPSDRLYAKFTRACIRSAMPESRRSFGRRK